ncbi:hypothetical protein TNCT_165622 [Trichonephila clavata]|uniref:Cuticle protein n=1 Tax=Trichonephila clavata TaxID=2740835 RepID=A0A8X6H031_TRICU|nr:hypothetical protein TNCT_165622 [Trichonephila clavata]
MIAKVVIFCAALAAARATYGAPALGLAIKAPAAPLLHAPVVARPILAAPVLTKTVVSAPAAVTTVQREVVTSHHAAPVAVAPVAVAAPIAYAKAPVYTTTITRTAPVAPILSHTGLLGAAPLAYGLGLGHGYAGHGYAGHGLVGHGLAGHGLAYSHGLGAHGLAYGPAVLGKVGYSKYLL